MVKAMEDFNMGPWRLRAVHETDVLDEESGQKIDLWVWFVATQDRDMWMSHGVSSDCSADIAQAMRDGIDGGDMDVFITYIGEPWKIIEPMPVQHAQMMRDMVGALERVPSELNRIRRMSRSELIDERSRDEIQSMTKTDFNPN